MGVVVEADGDICPGSWEMILWLLFVVFSIGGGGESIWKYSNELCGGVELEVNEQEDGDAGEN